MGGDVTSRILKIIFPKSFIVSVNIEGNNMIADVSIQADLADDEKISQKSNISEYDLIFLGEVFEHLIKPYSTMKKLVKMLRSGGYLIITTPNLTKIYNRILLLLGKPLYNYRPLGILPNDDHITVVNKKQMIALLSNLNMHVCAIKGYSYYERKLCVVPESHYARSGLRLRFLRKVVTRIMPATLNEGIIYVAKKT